MRKVFWDTNLFIYLLEAHPVYTGPTKELLSRIRRSPFQLVTSVMTSGELQTGPMRQGDKALAEEYKKRLKQTASLLPFGEDEADRYAEIRRTVPVRGADAVQLASAAVAGTTLFVTNDQRLTKHYVRGIDLFASIDLALQMVH